MTKPHRKTAMPVPGDVFVDRCGYMRVINEHGYTLAGDDSVTPEYEFDFTIFSVKDFLDDNKAGYFYLGNALTDEWEDG